MSVYQVHSTHNVRSQLQRSYVTFYSRIQREGLLYDAERDLLAIADFLVRDNT